MIADQFKLIHYFLCYMLYVCMYSTYTIHFTFYVIYICMYTHSSNMHICVCPTMNSKKLFEYSKQRLTLLRFTLFQYYVLGLGFNQISHCIDNCCTGSA